MLKTLKALVTQDKDLPDRVHVLQCREEFRTASIYDRLPYEFHQERGGLGGQEYIKLSDRAPSIRFGLPAIIVNDSVSLLFSEGHFPAIDIGGVANGSPVVQNLEALITTLTKETKLREVMLDAATRGSIGSVAVLLQLIEGRIFFKVMLSKFLTPFWKPKRPDQLDRVVEKYKVNGRTLRDRGYAIRDADLSADFWFKREWTDSAELWSLPWLVNPKREPEAPNEERPDPERSVSHGLGFVPIVWIKNLPGGDDIDGAPTVIDAALSNSIELDYQLSQAGRGLKYTSDPTLLIREPAYQEGSPVVKGAANALIMSEKGDAKMLEISGSGASAVLDYARYIREISLELCGGNRASADRLSAAQSGRAMELMNQGLIWLADKLRTSYGEGGLLSLLLMVFEANQRFAIIIGGEEIAAGTLPSPEKARVTLKWPPWYPPTASDHQAIATGLKTYRDAGIISRETAIAFVQHDFDVEDPKAEAARINAEQDEADKREIAKAQAMAPKMQPAAPAA